ncbi:MAG: hypothetical protein ACRDV9_01365 [Acidimicrobiia bacterium]
MIGAALAACLLPAAPAFAHSILGVALTNYKSRLVSVTPDDTGISVKVLEGGNRLQISSPRTEAVVLGYQDEQFLRIGPAGVFQNLNSPSMYRSATRLGQGELPPRADAKNAPEWKRVRGGSVAQWYDHRIHFIEEEYPPEVLKEPGKTHVVREWTVPVVMGDQTVNVSGQLAWVPPGAPFIWIALMVLLLVGVPFAARSLGAVQAIIYTLSAAIVLDAIDALAISLAAAKTGQFVPSLVFMIVGYGLGVTGIYRLHQGRREGLFLTFLSGVSILVIGGLSSIFVLFRSQFPVQYPLPVARISAVLGVALGASIGLLCFRALRSSRNPNDETLKDLKRRAA